MTRHNRGLAGESLSVAVSGSRALLRPLTPLTFLPPTRPSKVAEVRAEISPRGGFAFRALPPGEVSPSHRSLLHERGWEEKDLLSFAIYTP